MDSYCVEFGSILSELRHMEISKIFYEDISTPEFVMLTLVDNLSDGGKNVAVSDIVSRSAVTAQAVSKLLRALENKGYIQRCVDSEDRRRTEVSMRKNGRALFSVLQKRYEQFMKNVSEGFEANEYSELLRLTRKFQKLYAYNINKMAVR